MTEEQIKKIIEILERKKYEDDYAGDAKYSDEEYSQMIYEEVIKPYENK